MNKNVRKLISEAFGEIYEDMFSEDVSKLADALSPENKALAERLIENVKTLGAASSLNHSYDDSTKSDTKTKIFNYVTERLIEDYRNSKDPKIGDWLRSAFYPTEGSKFYRYLENKWSSVDAEKMQDAALSAYEQTMLAPGALDNLINSYKSGDGRFGGLVLSSLIKRISNYFRGYAGTGKKDMFSGGETSSGDAEDEETGKSMFDKIGSFAGMEDQFVDSNDSEDLSPERKALAYGIQRAKELGSTKQYTAWRELMLGATPKEVAKEFSDLFTTNNDVSSSYKNFIDAHGDNIGREIIKKFGVYWDMSSTNPKELQQSYSMDPSFGRGEHIAPRVKVSTTAMKEAQKNLNNVMSELGLKPTDYNSDVKREKILNTLIDNGKVEKAEEINKAIEQLKKATQQAKSRGQYDRDEPLIPSNEKEEAKVEKLFEGVEIKGVDLDALIERVMRKVQK